MKFHARFSLIRLPLEIGLSSEGKFSEISSLAPQAPAGLAQSGRGTVSHTIAGNWRGIGQDKEAWGQ